MQDKNAATTTQKLDTEEQKESLYRTKWLMAHNHLHTIVHDPSAKPNEVWADYLKELEAAEEIAKQPA
jgi:hypothetical protein